MSPLPPFVLQQRAGIAALCQSSRARRLALFGSALRSDFDPLRSDLDFVADFEALPPADYAEAYFQLKSGLETLFSRSVDLLTPASLRNPYLRARVLAEQREVYVA
jgi:uncharacterized protein